MPGLWISPQLLKDPRALQPTLPSRHVLDALERLTLCVEHRSAASIPPMALKLATCRHSPHDQYYNRLVWSASQPYFVLKAVKGESIGTREMYASAQGRESWIAACKLNQPVAPVVDQA